MDDNPYAAPASLLDQPLITWAAVRSYGDQVAWGIVCSVFACVVVKLPLVKAAILWVCVYVVTISGTPNLERDGGCFGQPPNGRVRVISVPHYPEAAKPSVGNETTKNGGEK